MARDSQRSIDNTMCNGNVLPVVFAAEYTQFGTNSLCLNVGTSAHRTGVCDHIYVPILPSNHLYISQKFIIYI